MKQLFCSYELSLLAKQKGFDEPCLAWWMMEKSFIYSEQNKADWMIKNSHVAISYKKLPMRCTAPLYQQLVDWFREKYQIYIYIRPYTTSRGIKYNTSVITSFKEEGRFHLAQRYFRNFKTYYEALDKAIFEAFKLI